MKLRIDLIGNDTIIVCMMGGINSLAIIYLLTDTLLSIYQIQKRHIDSEAGFSQTKREKKREYIIIIIAIDVVIMGLGVVYCLMWASSISNDIVSLVTLTLSLMSSDVVAIYKDKDKFVNN